MTSQAESDAELRRLAQSLLLVLEPILQALSALGVGAEGAEPGNCQNNWCPLCAAAAISHGEQHPVIDTLVAAGATMIAVIRAAAQSEADVSIKDGGLTSGPPSPRTSSGYQRIPVTLVD